jgi:hypothetical protein
MCKGPMESYRLEDHVSNLPFRDAADALAHDIERANPYPTPLFRTSPMTPPAKRIADAARGEPKEKTSASFASDSLLPCSSGVAPSIVDDPSLTFRNAASSGKPFDDDYKSMAWLVKHGGEGAASWFCHSFSINAGDYLGTTERTFTSPTS